MNTDDPNNQSENLPGCGLGIYALLLIFIGSLGIVGMIGGTIGLLLSEPEEARNLVHGSEVQVWRLQPMRNAGLLELTEVPAAWHDESPRFDGTTACVVRNDGVGRLADDVAIQFKWDEIAGTGVERSANDRMSITIQGESDSFTCHFGPDEGAERFLRQVEAERKKMAPKGSAEAPLDAPDPELPSTGQ